jgi:DNA-binding MarR family transcriptional regulator
VKSQTTRLSDPAGPGFRLENSPFYWLTRASGRYLLAMERRLKRIGMDVPRWRVLMILAETEPASISTLSEHAVIKLSTMTRIVGRMSEAGLVTTAASADDGRVTEARMTEEGRAALERVRREGSAVFGHVFGDAPDAEIIQLIGHLQRITEALAEVEARSRSTSGIDHSCD